MIARKVTTTREIALVSVARSQHDVVEMEKEHNTRLLENTAWNEGLLLPRSLVAHKATVLSDRVLLVTTAYALGEA